MSVTDPAMANFMGGRLVAAPAPPPPPPVEALVDYLTHDLSADAKRTLLTGLALTGLAAASGVNVPTEEIVKKAITLADSTLRELARRRP